jgi:hypothetical protein
LCLSGRYFVYRAARLSGFYLAGSCFVSAPRDFE